MIYVDNPAWYNGPIRGYWCHMATDSIDDIEELHLFAETLGLKREYFQLKAGMFPHYDLYEGKKLLGKGKHSQAIEKGALLAKGTELLDKCWIDKRGKPYKYDEKTHMRVTSDERREHARRK